MNKAVKKYLKKSMILMVLILIVNFLSFICVGIVLNINIASENISGFALLSIMVASIIAIGHYLDKKTYFITMLIFNVIAIFYMLYISLNKTAENWSDLVSIISYLFTMGIGLITATIIQSVVILKKRLQTKD